VTFTDKGERRAARNGYLAVNIIFAGVILLIMGYSFFYSPDEEKYPVPCIHEKITGEQCPSCGLSHAFSLIVRGRIDEAMQWNSASGGVFLFFAVQLLLRIILVVRIFLTVRYLRQISVVDAVVSSLMALSAFFPFLKVLWLSLF
jgi:hypothetical protein